MASAGQIRAARALLGWTQTEAAKKCKVGVMTLSRLETGARMPGERTMSDVVATFEANDIQFFDDGQRVGVALLRKDAPPH